MYKIDSRGGQGGFKIVLKEYTRQFVGRALGLGQPRGPGLGQATLSVAARTWYGPLIMIKITKFILGKCR